MESIAIVGAGIAGLACAHELVRAGFEVTVFEEEPAVGGRMSTRVRDGLAFDTGANFLVDAYSYLHELGRELRLAVEDVGRVPHVFLRQGRWEPMNMSSPRDVIGLSGLSIQTRMKLLFFALQVRRRYGSLDFFDLPSTPPELNRGNAWDYCTTQVSEEFARYIVDPFTTCMMFHGADEVSPAAFVSLLSEMIDPAFSFGIQHVAGEMASLPRALASKLDVRTSTPVQAVRPGRDDVALRTEGETRDFRRVVLATPAPTALRILATPSVAQAEILSATAYSSTINVSFRIPMGALGDTHCFYVPRSENALVSEFTNEAVKGAHTTCGGWSLLNAGLHESAARDLMSCSDERIYEIVRRELVSIHPDLATIPDQVLPHDLQRWPHALPKYTASHIDLLRLQLARAQGQGNVWLAGDYLGGPWLEGAARCGRRVAREIAATVDS